MKNKSVNDKVNQVNNFVNKPVCFNLSDPDQKKMFDHASKRPNFSSYIKRLIQRDLDGIFIQRSIINEETLANLDESLMKNLI